MNNPPSQIPTFSKIASKQAVETGTSAVVHAPDAEVMQAERASRVQSSLLAHLDAKATAKRTRVESGRDLETCGTH